MRDLWAFSGFLESFPYKGIYKGLGFLERFFIKVIYQDLGFRVP